MKKLIATVATVLICLCFLASVDRDKQQMIFCNETEDGRNKISDFKFSGAKLLRAWEKDNKECTRECSYWRVWEIFPEEVICVEILYHYGKEEI